MWTDAHQIPSFLLLAPMAQFTLFWIRLVTFVLSIAGVLSVTAGQSINVNFRSGKTISVGASFHLAGTAQTDGAAITNISVMVGKAKVAQAGSEVTTIPVSAPASGNVFYRAILKPN